MRDMIHTPGPWTWYWRQDNGNEADCGVMSGAESGRARSVCRAPRYESEKQWEANARLISAAPELLEALQAMLRAETNQHHATAGALAYAAITKATGEKS